MEPTQTPYTPPTVPADQVQPGFGPRMQATEVPPQPQYEEQALPPEEEMAANPYGPGMAYAPQAPEPEYLIMEWVADSRVVRPRSREFYSSLSVIVVLISLILITFNQFLLILVLLSLLFITYVLNTVKAEDVVHQFTTYGIRYQGKLYYWQEMTRFWVRDNRGVPEIHVEAPVFLAQRMIILPANSRSAEAITANDIVDVLSRYLPYDEPLPSQVDRWVQWLEEKFPLEPTLPKE